MAILPRPMTQRAKNAMATKNNLFETALALFLEHGYDTVTIDDITSHAGVGKGTFYTHFETKEAVLVEQFKKIDDHYDAVLAQYPKETPGSELLLALVDAMAYYCSTVCGIDIMRIVYASQINKATVNKVKILNDRNRGIYAHFREIIRRGREQGEFHCTLPETEVEELLMRSCRSLIYDWCLYGEEMDLRKECHRYFTLLISVLKSWPNETTLSQP